MDKNKALQLEATLKGKDLSGYTVIRFLNNGKSGAVYEAKGKNGNTYALKIFDTEMVEKYGHEIQIARIKQELSLKDHDIENLVKIVDGGDSVFNGEKFHFIVMEYVSGKNLKEYIEKETYGENFIKKVLSTLYDITEKLIKKGIAHRDIKPENIMIDSNGRIILMDLGVLKFIGTESFSDDNDAKQFVGTLRYAAPEFLFRTEGNDEKHWRSLNYYQIGGILHDLIMKRELFQDRTPFSNLVLAIREDNPEISNPLYSTQLVQLTRDLLIKNWENRLASVSAERIKNVVFSEKAKPEQSDIQKIFEIRHGHESKRTKIAEIKRTAEEREQIRRKLFSEIIEEIRKIPKYLVDENVISKMEGGDLFLLEEENINKGAFAVTNIIYKIPGNLSYGFPKSMYWVFSVKNDETGFCEIKITAFFLGNLSREDMKNPSIMFTERSLSAMTKWGTSANANHTQRLSPKWIQLFNGTFSNKDDFSTIIRQKLLKVIVAALEIAKPVVENELEMQEKEARGEKVYRMSMSGKKVNILFNTTFITPELT